MAKENDLQRVGRAVTARRGELGMTRQELADKAGVDLKTIYNLESGTRWPIARTRAAVTAALRWEGDALAEIATGHETLPPAPTRPRRRLKVLEDADEPGLVPYLQAVRREVYAAADVLAMFPVGDLPGPETIPEIAPLLDALPGEEAFPGSPTEPAVWDMRDRLTVAERIRLIARLRRMTAEAAPARDRRASG